jgi:hypothetical protein
MFQPFRAEFITRWVERPLRDSERRSSPLAAQSDRRAKLYGVAKTLAAWSLQVAETTIRLFINSGVAKSFVLANRTIPLDDHLVARLLAANHIIAGVSSHQNFNA